MLTTRQDAEVGEVPQDGVFSPLFLSMVVDGLLHRLTELGITPVSHADDIVRCGLRQLLGLSV